MIMAKKNFFEKMSLQIPLKSTSIIEYYSLSKVDQEILADDCRKFMEAKLEALRAIPSTPAQSNQLLRPLGDPQRDPQRVQPHKTQLKKSYTPKRQPCIRRIGKVVTPGPAVFNLKPGHHDAQ